MRRSEALRAARSSPWLSRQSRDFQTLLCAKARVLSFGRNASIFHIGDPSDDIFCMLRGTTITLGAHPVIGMLSAAVMHPGFWFGEPATLGQRPRLTSVLTRKGCDILAVPLVTIYDMIEARPDFARPFFELMANNTEEYMLHGIDLVIQNPRQRLCSRLLTLAGRRIAHPPEQSAIIPFSQEELALTSAMSRQTVSQLLGELVELGICELTYRQVRILDSAALQKIISNN